MHIERLAVKNIEWNCFLSFVLTAALLGLGPLLHTHEQRCSTTPSPFKHTQSTYLPLILCDRTQHHKSVTMDGWTDGWTSHILCSFDQTLWADKFLKSKFKLDTILFLIWWVNWSYIQTSKMYIQEHPAQIFVSKSNWIEIYFPWIFFLTCGPIHKTLSKTLNKLEQ